MSDEHIKVLREQSEVNPVTTVNGRVYVTVDKEALDAAIAALGGVEKKRATPKFTYGHCENHKQAGGCQLHNLHCGYPDCDRRPAPPSKEG